jgi:hypothetical protein
MLYYLLGIKSRVLCYICATKELYGALTYVQICRYISENRIDNYSWEFYDCFVDSCVPLDCLFDLGVRRLQIKP